MIKFAAIILISFLSVAGVYNYIPLKYFELFSLPSTNFGSTITTINSTDTLKDSRSVINTNFSNLNSDKIEVGTTTMGLLTSAPNLATIGTITTGVWNGTGIDVARQGTGTTTICLNNVILGNTTSGFKCVNGHGTSGQFLTSGGVGAVPTWTTSAINEAGDYTWTGEHSFTSATTTVADITKLTVVSGGTFTFDGTFAQSAASSTVLSRDASGNDAWMPTMLEIASTTLTGAANTIDLQNIPAAENLHIIISTLQPGTGSAASMILYFNNDVAANYNLSLVKNDGSTLSAEASTTATQLGLTGKSPVLDGGIIFSIDVSNSQQSVKRVTWTGGLVDDANVGQSPYSFTGLGFWSNTSTRINRITIKLSKNTNFPIGSRITVWGSSN